MKDDSITQEGYQERPELDYSQYGQYRSNLKLFEARGHILHPNTRAIYETIKNYCRDFVVNHPQYPKFKWKPKIIDVCCGGGFGANILSQEGEFVWGIDKDEKSIAWAKEVFTRHRNNIYFTPELEFEVIDVNTEDREIQAFDIVTCVNSIEHFADYKKLLEFLKKRCKKDKKGNYLEPPDATKVFISTNNRNNDKMGKLEPKIPKHVREWTPAELYEILTSHFKYVTLMDIFGNLKELDMSDSLMVFKCETPI